MPPTPAVVDAASTESRQIYTALLKGLRKVGPFQEDPKKTCVHLVRTSAFAGVHFRKQHLLVTIKLARPLESSRVVKLEQASKNRWHADVKLGTPSEIDPEFLSWVREGYELCQ